MQPTFVFEIVGAVFVLAHTKDSPSEEEWAAYMSAMNSRLSEIERLRTVVFTDGGAPNSRRRDEINRLLAGRPTRAAIVSTAAAVRFVVSSLALFNPAISSFGPADIHAALRHVDLLRDRKLVRESALRLQGRIGAGRCRTLEQALAAL